MLADLSNTIATIIGVLVALLGAFLFAFWAAMGIWTFNDIRSRTRDWLAIGLASLLVLIFPILGLILYMMIRPRETLADVFDRALEEESLLREMEATLSCHSLRRSGAGPVELLLQLSQPIAVRMSQLRQGDAPRMEHLCKLRN